MPSPNELKKARCRATAQLLEVACLNGGWTRPGLDCSAPPTWLAMGPQRRAAYCSAERLMSPTLVDQLIVEYPAAGKAWDPLVWSCLSQDATTAFLERTLRRLVAPDKRKPDLGGLLKEVAEPPLADAGTDIERVVIYVCATRLAKIFSRQASNARVSARSQQRKRAVGQSIEENAEDRAARKNLPGLLAMRLARALYVTSVDDLFAPWAKAVWVYAGHIFVNGLRADEARVRFSDEAYEFAREYVGCVEAEITLKMLPQDPPCRLSVLALKEVVSYALNGLTEPSCSKAYRTMHAITEMDVSSSRRRRHMSNALILEPMD